VSRDPSGVRVVALHVPDLPLQRVRRGREPGADGERPLAVVAEGRVAHCDPAARAAGVRPGGTVAEALAACGRLVLAQLEPAADRAALRALAEALLGLAPAVELSPPDVLLLDAGAAHLLAPRGGAREAGEEALARRAAVPVFTVDSNSVVPLSLLGPAVSAAAHLRPRIHKAFAEAWPHRVAARPRIPDVATKRVKAPFDGWKVKDVAAFVDAMKAAWPVP